MIVLVVHGIRIFPYESESNPPVPTDRDCPSPSLRALEWMQIQPWKCHIVWGCGGTEATKDQAKTGSVLGLNARLGTSLVKLRQPFVSESSDHRKDCNLNGYRMQGGCRGIDGPGVEEKCVFDLNRWILVGVKLSFGFSKCLLFGKCGVELHGSFFGYADCSIYAGRNGGQ